MFITPISFEARCRSFVDVHGDLFSTNRSSLAEARVSIGDQEYCRPFQSGNCRIGMYGTLQM